MEWLVWSESRTISPPGKTSHFFPLQMSQLVLLLKSIPELFAPYTATSILTPGLCRFIDSHCATLFSLRHMGTSGFPEHPCRPWWAKSLALDSSTEPSLFTSVALFSLPHIAHAVKLTAEFLEDSASQGHNSGNHTTTPNFLRFPPSMWILQLYTSNSSFHPEKGQKVCMLRLIPLPCSLLSNLRAIRDGFFSLYVRSFPYVPYPLHACDEIFSASFLWAMMAWWSAQETSLTNGTSIGRYFKNITLSPYNLFLHISLSYRIRY